MNRWAIIRASLRDEERGGACLLPWAEIGGAEDFAREGEQYLVTTAPGAFHAVQDALKGHGFAVESAELTMVPKNTVKVEGADAERILKLMEALEELDDVSRVSSNFDIDAAQLAEAQA
jgi:transcriptional/translational regulatory protein YebC/TACO1